MDHKEKEMPDYAFMPAKGRDEEETAVRFSRAASRLAGSGLAAPDGDDGFDPTPYDRLLGLTPRTRRVEPAGGGEKKENSRSAKELQPAAEKTAPPESAESAGETALDSRIEPAPQQPIERDGGRPIIEPVPQLPIERGGGRPIIEPVTQLPIEGDGGRPIIEPVPQLPIERGGGRPTIEPAPQLPIERGGGRPTIEPVPEQQPIVPPAAQPLPEPEPPLVGVGEPLPGEGVLPEQQPIVPPAAQPIPEPEPPLSGTEPPSPWRPEISPIPGAENTSPAVRFMPGVNSPISGSSPIPGMKPNFARLSGETEGAAHIIPLSGQTQYTALKITDTTGAACNRIYIEEDILVPDIKPDLAKILMMDAEPRITGRETVTGTGGEEILRITGELELQTIYMPENGKAGEALCIIQSRIPFRYDWTASLLPTSGLEIEANAEQPEYTVINERKFRAKTYVNLCMEEYRTDELQLFDGIRGEQLELLREKILITDIAARKTENAEISEELSLKDSQPDVEKLLKYTFSVVENHRQITGEKAVINAGILCTVMYTAAAEEAEQTASLPHLYQGKTDVTQFLLLPGLESPAGSRVRFCCEGLTLTLKDPRTFIVSGSIATSVEIYRNVEKEVVADFYSREKEMTCDITEVPVRSVAGSGVTEVSAREIVNIPEKHGELERVIWLGSRIGTFHSKVEQNKNVVEGTVSITMLCTGGDMPYALTRQLPFRGSMEIPGGLPSMTADTSVQVRDLWFDKINARQAEVNVSLSIMSSVSRKCICPMIRNVCCVEPAGEAKRLAGMILYITKKGDTLWKVARNYKTTVESLRIINELAPGTELTAGMKLLIVR